MKRGGTGAAYLLRRLARDFPDILIAYERGEYRSVRAAAKAAGIIKEKSAFEKICKLLPKLPNEDFTELRTESGIAFQIKRDEETSNITLFIISANFNRPFFAIKKEEARQLGIILLGMGNK